MLCWAEDEDEPCADQRSGTRCILTSCLPAVNQAMPIPSPARLTDMRGATRGVVQRKDTPSREQLRFS